METLSAKTSHWDSPFPFLLVRFKRFLYFLIRPLCTGQRTRGCRASMSKFKIHARFNPLFQDALCERLSSHFRHRIYSKLPNLGTRTQWVSSRKKMYAILYALLLGQLSIPGPNSLKIGLMNIPTNTIVCSCSPRVKGFWRNNYLTPLFRRFFRRTYATDV